MVIGHLYMYDIYNNIAQSINMSKLFSALMVFEVLFTLAEWKFLHSKSASCYDNQPSPLSLVHVLCSIMRSVKTLCKSRLC